MASSQVVGFSVRYYVAGRETPLALRELKRAFEVGAAKTARWGEFLFPRLMPILEKASNAQFTARGKGPNAGKWARLSPAYEKWKRKHYPGKGILERSGLLREALTQSNGRYAQRVYSATQMTFGTSALIYASFHQTGTEEGMAAANRKKFTSLPARPPFDFRRETAQEISKVGQEAARELMRSSRLEEFGTFNPGPDAELDRQLASELERVK